MWTIKNIIYKIFYCYVLYIYIYMSDDNTSLQQTQNVDDYDELAGFNIISGDIKTETILNNGGTTATDLTAPSSGNFGDAEIWTFEVLVSSAGAVTYKMGKHNDAVIAPTGAVAFSFDTGEEVTPFLYIKQASDLTPVILHSLEYGLQ